MFNIGFSCKITYIGTISIGNTIAISRRNISNVILQRSRSRRKRVAKSRNATYKPLLLPRFKGYINIRVSHNHALFGQKIQVLSSESAKAGKHGH